MRNRKSISTFNPRTWIAQGTLTEGEVQLTSSLSYIFVR
jgi:hypothetical protein